MVVLKYGWWIWGFSLPVFLVTYVYSFFLASKIAYESQTDCRPKFIFTPKDVEYCSDIYPINVFLISLKTCPLSYLCIASGMFFILHPLYQLYKKSFHIKRYIWHCHGSLSHFSFIFSTIINIFRCVRLHLL